MSLTSYFLIVLFVAALSFACDFYRSYVKASARAEHCMENTQFWNERSEYWEAEYIGQEEEIEKLSKALAEAQSKLATMTPNWFQRVCDTIGDPSEDRIVLLPDLTGTQLEALRQLACVCWDGNLVSKSARTELVQKGLAARWNGLNFATQAGFSVLETMKMLGDTSILGGWGATDKEGKQ